jgi:hypothetical protein
MLNLPLTPEDSASLDTWSAGYARGKSEEQQRAAGLIRELVPYLEAIPRWSQGEKEKVRYKAALAYLAEAEAAQKGDG